MKLQINDLGSVKTGSLDLSKRFNLFCGQNGTGKTYFSYVIYGLLRTKLHVRSDSDYIDTLINDRSYTWSIDYGALLGYRSAMLKQLSSQLDVLFGLGVAETNKIFADFSMQYCDSEDEFKSFIHASAISIVEEISDVQIGFIKEADSDQVEISVLSPEVPISSISDIRFSLQSVLYYDLVTFPVKEVVIFPIERNSIYTFSKELSIRKQEAVDNFQLMVSKEKKYNKWDMLFSNNKRYPLPIKDGLIVAEDLVEYKKNKSPYYDYAEEMEKDLLHGKVLISTDGDIQFKPDKSPRTVLPIQMTASMIKTLSSLVVYLKHIARKDDLIIIDEPEVNLHPDNQIILTRILARLMNRGFRLLVSTHSDYVIREINNLVLMSHTENNAVSQLAKSNGYTPEEFIDKNDLAVHIFKYPRVNSKKVNVVDAKVDEMGFDVKSIDDVIRSQTALSEDLYYAYKYELYAEH